MRTNQASERPARWPFRDGSDRELLAMDPRAFGLFFDVPPTPEAKVNDGIAVMEVRGPLEHHMSWCWTSYDQIREGVVEALDDEEVKALVLRIDSPGGVVAGLDECHREILRAQKCTGKIVYAYIDERAVSAAYHLACACRGGIWLPPAGQVGSVGVILRMVDVSRAMEKDGVRVELVTTGARKADSYPERQLTEEILQVAKEHVDYLGGMFFRAVARSRGMDPDAVRALEAGIFFGRAAEKTGLADGVSSWAKFISTVREKAVSVGTNGADVGRAPALPAGSSSEAKAMLKGKKKIEALKKAKSDAAAALNEARGPKARAKALTEYEAAVLALTKAEEAPAPPKAAAKPARRPATVPAAEEEEEDDEEEEEESDDEEDDSDDSDEEEEEGEEEDDEEEEEESDDADEKAAARAFSAAAKPGLYSPDRLLRLCQEVTGQKSIKSVFGALDGLGSRLKAADKLQARVGKLEERDRAQRVDSMLAKAKTDGKIGKAEVESLRAKGMQDPKWLKGHLAVLPKRVRTLDEGEFKPRQDADGNPVGGATAEQQAILEKACAGMSAEERAKFIEATGKKLNGAAPKTPRF